VKRVFTDICMYVCTYKFVDDKEGEKNNLDEENSSAKRPRVGKSKVWSFYKKSSDGMSAKCRSCEKVYRTSGNTSNLYDHLKRVHPTLNVAELPESLKINAFVSTNYDCNSKRKADLDMAVMKYIATDMRPFAVVEDSGFRNMLNVFDPRYKLLLAGH